MLLGVAFALIAWLPLQASITATAAPLRVQLRWLPQTQFAGFYVAKEFGLFDKAGIAVELQPGGPGVDPLGRLQQGQTDVAIGWTSDALNLRRDGADLVNVAQLFQRPGTMLVCSYESGVKEPSDLRGKLIGSWFLGDQFDVGYWLSRHGLGLSTVRLKPQRANAADLLDGRVDCVTAMSYNEFQTILSTGALKSDLFRVRFGADNDGFLEDGLYVRSADLHNPRRKAQFAALLQALSEGWRYAERYPDEAVAITARAMSNPDLIQQRNQLNEVLQLMDISKGFGLLNQGAFERSVTIISQGSTDPAGISAAAQGAWSLKIWRSAKLDGPQRGPLGPAGLYHLNQIVSSLWFYSLDLIGTGAFALSGFLRALQRRYDLWGCFVLSMLPAVGGGTMRDLLIGGMRSPPFIFEDGAYLAVVVAIASIGCIAAPALREGSTGSPWFNWLFTLCDTVGLATFTVIGAKVALMAHLMWWWIPICAALTCAGGGMLLDVITGREPRTFQGEPYEELALLGSLGLIAGLLIADCFETHSWPVSAALIGAWLSVFVGRLVVIRYQLRSWRPGLRNPGRKASSQITIDQ